MSDEMEVTYYIDDSYAGSHGAPHTITIDREDYEGLSDQGIKNRLFEEIRRDMNQILHPYCGEIADVIAWAKSSAVDGDDEETSC